MEGLSFGALQGIGFHPDSATATTLSARSAKMLSFLESLAKAPNKAGDFEEHDDIGRPVQIKIIGNYALTYWADHAVKEIKVVKVEKADRQ